MGERILDIKLLLTQVSEGDEKAFEELFFSYKDIVYSVAIIYTESLSDAEEIVQEVFVRVWEYRKRLLQVNEFDGWIRTVTRNRCLSALKKKAIRLKREKGLPEFFSCENTTAEQRIRTKELQSLLGEAMNQLSPRQRKIFELSRLEGMDRRTISKSLRISAATVSVHLTIALRKVGTFLYSHGYMWVFFYLFCLPVEFYAKVF